MLQIFSDSENRSLGIESVKDSLNNEKISTTIHQANDLLVVRLNELIEGAEERAMVAMMPMLDLGIPHEKLNIHGGACALGHPIGSTGSRIILTLIHALKRTGGKRGVASLCIGGGEATAVAVELV